jgi:hypothetical protein
MKLPGVSREMAACHEFKINRFLLTGVFLSLIGAVISTAGQTM